MILHSPAGITGSDIMLSSRLFLIHGELCRQSVVRGIKHGFLYN